MKLIPLATILTLLSTSIIAEENKTELGAGLRSNSEVKFDYNIDEETYTLTFAPEIEYDIGAVEIAVGSDINMRDIDFTGLDYTATMPIEGIRGMEMFGTVKTDDEWDFDDVHVGVTFNF
mgnify:CR=1 FL=1|jgi:hypothetical protein|tara:strand:+ start:809 stop:1168 length:360 start_codon:yes stop_codon:yes gene_type:complete